jgi:hypothetical protein
MAHDIFGRVFTIKMLIRAAFTALSISLIGVAHSEPYHTPTHNFYQNNWIAGGGG